MLKEAISRWNAADASDLYDVHSWGKGYFSVRDDGRLLVHPEKDPDRCIDLLQLTERLQMRGLETPVLIRFNDILKNRLAEIHDAFERARKDHDYRGKYTCVYPVKVNQQRQVVEEIIRHGRPYGFGLEAGSKPELLAVVAMTDAETPIVCNGFKDAEFIEMAMLAQKLGRRVIPVVEKYTELDLILQCARKVDVRPEIGARIKLAARGSGRWQSSGGYRSKFGLSVTEVLQMLDQLQQQGMADCFKLLHFHLGSQITNIRHIKGALIEAARAYVDLARRGAGLQYLDVGGGLGVDYDGSQTDFESSVNYTLQEYANDVVYHLQTICDEADVPHPNIISESGRAVAAYHSLLVFEVLGVSSQAPAEISQQLPEGAVGPLRGLWSTYHNLTARNALESYHDAQQALEMAINMFCTGGLSLDQRSLSEELFWAICQKIQRHVEQMEYVPEELQNLDRLMADTYFCNFSLFQSMPDSWAIGQIFPLMPIHRLDEEPTRHAVLGDITCDSDGKVDRFIDRRDVRRTLPLHNVNGSRYYLAAFLIGAYQEILGDLHNLFGDTNAVHVSMSDEGEVVLNTIVKGDTVSDALHYVQFQDRELLARVQTAVETAVQQNLIDHGEAGHILQFYEESLRGYTYLEHVHQHASIEA